MEIYNKSKWTKDLHEKYNIPLVGVELLDQHQRDFGYNPTIKAINAKLSEIIDNNSQIAGFTVTFRKSFHNDDDLWLHNYVHCYLDKARTWNKLGYMMFPEYNKNGILHYHGIIWGEYQATVMLALKSWRRKFGFVKPELNLSSKYNWIKYITKDYNKVGLYTLMNFP